MCLALHVYDPNNQQNDVNAKTASSAEHNVPCQAHTRISYPKMSHIFPSVKRPLWEDHEHSLLIPVPVRLPLFPGGWWGFGPVTLDVSSVVLKGRSAVLNRCALLQTSESIPSHSTLCWLWPLSLRYANTGIHTFTHYILHSLYLGHHLSLEKLLDVSH